MSFIIIGNTHFKVNNIPDVDLFITNITNLVKEKTPDIIVLLGDTLDTHERLHTIPLNKAYEFINNMRKITKTYVITGNHDMINHVQFLTTNHWLNALKEWDNVIIVDKVLMTILNNKKYIFCPFVSPGRFEEALNTLEEEWKDATCIFAHQEFYGCKMGAIVSVDGDKWSLEYPNVISGHIHSNQIPQENIYYPGSSLQVSFGESQNNIIAYVTFKNDKEYSLEEIDLNLRKKKIVYKTIEDIEEYNIPKTEDEIKVSLSGEYNEFKTFKKTKKYKELLNKGIKVVFKPTRKYTEVKNENLKKVITNNTGDLSNFKKIITEIVEEQKDPYLDEVFKIVMNNKN